MLTVVVILLAVVAVYATNLVPPAREPTVTVKMSWDDNNVSLYHKGGDAIAMSDLRIMVNGIEKTRNSDWRLYDQEEEEIPSPEGLYDLGTWIILSAEKHDEIRIATDRSTLFTGVV